MWGYICFIFFCVSLFFITLQNVYSFSLNSCICSLMSCVITRLSVVRILDCGLDCDMPVSDTAVRCQGVGFDMIGTCVSDGLFTASPAQFCLSLFRYTTLYFIWALALSDQDWWGILELFAFQYFEYVKFLILLPLFFA